MYLRNYYQLYISSDINPYMLFIQDTDYKNKNYKDINAILKENRCKIINSNSNKYIYQLKNINNKLKNIMNNNNSENSDNSDYSYNTFEIDTIPILGNSNIIEETIPLLENLSDKIEDCDLISINKKKIKYRYKKYSYLDYPFVSYQ
jgi:hypothetical protein